MVSLYAKVPYDRLRDLGYAEGRNYIIEQRSAGADIARLPALVAELLALNVDAMIPSSTQAALAAHKAAREIPILIATVSDPVGVGLASSLRRPGGNVTGLTNIAVELYTKRLDLLRQTLPGMRRVGLLYVPDYANDVQGLKQFEVDCAKLGFKSIRAPVRKVEEIAAAFNLLTRDKAQGLIVSGANATLAWRDSIIKQAATHRLPAIYNDSMHVDSGGLISYSANRIDIYRRTAAYADKIFKGAKPGDLPIEQPTKFELAVNLKTAKVLGIKISNSILVQATKVIE